VQHCIITLTEAWELFALECRSRRLTPASIDFYRWRLQPFFAYCTESGVTTLDGIDAPLIRRYLVQLHERDLSEYSVHAAARAIRRWLNFCVAEELLDASPMRKVKMPTLNRPILPALSDADIRRIIAACHIRRDKAIVYILLDTGLRAAELVSLNGGDIDLHTGAIIVTGKGRKERHVYLSPASQRELRRYYRQRGRPSANGPAFRSERNDQRLTRSGLFQLMRRLARASGVPNCKPHTFRRTFALTMLRQGCDLYTLQHLMGHEDVQMLRRYLAISDDDAQAAHDKYSPVAALLP
jgi:site-specific recombinase XerD